MGLFDFIENVVKLPIAIVVDVVKSPARIVDGEAEDLLKHTGDVIDDLLD